MLQTEESTWEDDRPCTNDSAVFLCNIRNKSMIRARLGGPTRGTGHLHALFVTAVPQAPVTRHMGQCVNTLLIEKTRWQLMRWNSRERDDK